MSMRVDDRKSDAPPSAIVAILTVALGWFLYRGPWLAFHGGGGDYAAPFVSSLRFVKGYDPYSTSDLATSWIAIGRAAGTSMDTWVQGSVYPPSTFIVLYPFTLFRWMQSLVLLEVVCTALFGYVLYLLAQMVGKGWRSWSRIGFIATGLLLAPIHTGLKLGNPSILAFLLCMYALLLSWRRSTPADIAAGLCLGFALCMKPTVGLVMLSYMILFRHWKLLFLAIGTGAAISTLALFRMMHFAGWPAEYRAQVSALFGPHGSNNFTSANGHRFDILNLQVPFFVLTNSTTGANVATWLAVAIMFGAWLLYFRGDSSPQAHLEAPTAILLIGLLPVYERNYNAGFVLLAVLWGLQNLHTRRGKCMLALCAVCLLPGEAILRVIASRSPVWRPDNFFMNFFVLPHLTWVLVAMVALLLRSMARSRSRLARSATG